MGKILRIDEFIPLTNSPSADLQVAKETKEGKDGHMPPHPVVLKLPGRITSLIQIYSSRMIKSYRTRSILYKGRSVHHTKSIHRSVVKRRALLVRRSDNRASIDSHLGAHH